MGTRVAKSITHTHNAIAREYPGAHFQYYFLVNQGLTAVYYKGHTQLISWIRGRPLHH